MLIAADDTARTDRELAAESSPVPTARTSCVRGATPAAAGYAPATAVARSAPDAAAPGCGRSHVLVPGVMLPRRADAIEVVGEALTAHASGEGHRSIAAWLGRPAATVRGWLRRFGARAEQTR